MIPKIIHYCWFGPKKFPKTEKKCIATWREHLPDYEFRLWNERNAPMDHPFVKQAYHAKKYAFVADFVRLWAIYKFGGVYLDTDMFLIKSLTPLLSMSKVFLGYETEDNKYINAAIIGSEPNHDFIQNILNCYERISFSDNIKNLSKIAIPKQVTKTYKSCVDKKNIIIYPFDYFYPYPFIKKEDKDFMSYITANTFAVHLWSLSWVSPMRKVIGKLQKHLNMFSKIIRDKIK
jgi:mannosyltransferase OCH1-like enzyme